MWGPGLSRRSLPVLAGTLAPLVVFFIPWFGPHLNEASVPIGVVVLSAFTLGRYPPDRRGLFGMAIVFGVIALDYALVDPREHNWGDVVFVVACSSRPMCSAASSGASRSRVHSS